MDGRESFRAFTKTPAFALCLVGGLGMFGTGLFGLNRWAQRAPTQAVMDYLEGRPTTAKILPKARELESFGPVESARHESTSVDGFFAGGMVIVHVRRRGTEREEVYLFSRVGGITIQSGSRRGASGGFERVGSPD